MTKPSKSRTFWALVDLDGEIQFGMGAVIVGQPIDADKGRVQIYATKEQAEMSAFEDERIVRVTITYPPKRKGARRCRAE